MKADLSRSTFDARHHYKRVPLQQGRVQTDADTNEQQAITLHRIETEAADLIGGCGGPIHAAGFEVVPDGDDLRIGAGRYYVDGWLCENEAEVAYSTQPDYPLDAPFLAGLPDPPVTVPPDADTYLVYLDVWERHLTALEAPHIREVALGGPDTATRGKAVWQVKLHPLTGAEAADPDCLSTIPSWDEAVASSTGEMGARVDVATPSSDPCIVEPGAGYRRLENQLYRVEVHEGGPRNAATFKWDRDNGTIVARLESQSPDLTEWTVSSMGRDAVLRFAPEDWVELTDDTRELLGLHGVLVQIDRVDGNVITVNLDNPADPAFRLPVNGSVDMADFPLNPKVRRWNGVLRDVTNQNYLDLEDGVQVRLRGGSGADGQPRRYHAGDYWMIPARTNTGTIEWPTENGGWQLARGIRHHYCRLALATFDGTAWADLTDCRSLFPSVTELTSLFYVGGDGQECMPGEELPLPLRVGVANGKHPVENAQVRFTVTSGNAEVAAASGGAAQSTLVASTDAAGLASCFWSPADAPLEVEAVLLDAAGQPAHLPVHFGANLSTADEVAYTPGEACTLPATVATVQDALDALCQREGAGCRITIGPGPDWEAEAQAAIAAVDSFHLCFQSGSYPLTAPLRLQEKGHVTISGCGPATRFVIEEAETVFDAEACASVRFADFYAEARYAADRRESAEAEHLKGVLNVVGCGSTTVERVVTRCAGGVRRAVTGITVRDSISGDEASGASPSTRIRGCTIGIGHRQTGILAANVYRVVIEDNHLHVMGRPAGRDIFELLQGDAHYRRVLGEVLLGEPVVSRQPVRARRPRSEARRRLLRAGLSIDAVEVRAQLGPFHISFFTPEGIEGAWQELLAAHPVQAGETPDSARQHLQTLRSQLLAGTLRGPEAADVIEWLNDVVASNPAVAWQGIVVAKNQAADEDPPAPDVRVVNNRIEGCQQGVHIGASHRETEAESRTSDPDYVDTVLVSGNTIDVILSPETSRGRHGIFVGNVRHLAVQDNCIRVQRTDPGGAWQIDGIRLYGCFGPMLIARQNHISGATVGIRINPLDDSCWPDVRHWYVADNVAPGAVVTVRAQGPVTTERNFP